MSSRPLLKRGASAGVSALLAAALGAAPGIAGPVEQVSRATGPQGAAAFTTYQQPLYVSNDGRYSTFIDRNPNGSDAPLLVRDIVANTTTRTGALPVNAAVLGIDRAHTRLLVRQDQTVTLRSATGALIRTITTLNPDQYQATAALSGNGKVIVVSDGGSVLTFLSAETGATLRTVTGDQQLRLTGQTISDDGSVVAGELGSAFGFYVRGSGPIKAVGHAAVVSGDGSTVVAVGPFPGDPVEVTKTADGTTREIAAPSTSYNFPLWLAPDGSKVVTSSFSQANTANLVDLATGRSSRYGGAVSPNLNGDLVGPRGPQAVLSDNLKYALFFYGGYASGQLAVADAAGADLPGDQEPFSASTYVQVSPPYVSDCTPGSTTEISALFQRPGAWVPKPRAAWIRVTVDGKVLLSKTLTKPYDWSVYPSLEQPNWQTVTFPISAKRIVITALTVDGNGRTSLTTEVTEPYAFCQN